MGAFLKRIRRPEDKVGARAEFLAPVDPLGGRAALCTGRYPGVCRSGVWSQLPRDVPLGKSLNLSVGMI